MERGEHDLPHVVGHLVAVPIVDQDAVVCSHPRRHFLDAVAVQIESVRAPTFHRDEFETVAIEIKHHRRRFRRRQSDANRIVDHDPVPVRIGQR